MPTGDLHAVLTPRVGLQQRGGAASGRREAEDDNAAAGAAPTNAHDAQVSGPRRLWYVCRHTPTHTYAMALGHTYTYTNMRIPTHTPTPAHLHMCLHKQLHIPKCLYTPAAGIDPQACARKPFQVPACTRSRRASRRPAQGVYPLRFCSTVVPHATPTMRILATVIGSRLRPCDSLSVVSASSLTLPRLIPPRTPPFLLSCAMHGALLVAVWHLVVQLAGDASRDVLSALARAPVRRAY